nr:MAG TPA: hypothetical protein [Caudoviricetes sp.]
MILLSDIVSLSLVIHIFISYQQSTKTYPHSYPQIVNNSQ